MIKRLIKKALRNKPKLYELSIVILNFIIGIKNFIMRGTAHKIYLISLDDKKLCYLVNNKVACSSIIKTFLKQHISDDNSSIHKYDWKKITKKEAQNSDYFKFTFVRNPFSRLVSCYKDKYGNNERDKRETIGVFDRYLLGIIKRNKGFDHFVKMVNFIPGRLAEGHFLSQYLLIYTGNKKSIVDYIGKFENIEDDFDALKRRFSLEALPHFNKTSGDNWMDYYTIKTANIVYKKYKKDFLSFDYNHEYDKLINYINNKSKEERNEK